MNTLLHTLFMGVASETDSDMSSSDSAEILDNQGKTLYVDSDDDDTCAEEVVFRTKLLPNEGIIFNIRPRPTEGKPSNSGEQSSKEVDPIGPLKLKRQTNSCDEAAAIDRAVEKVYRPFPHTHDTTNTELCEMRDKNLDSVVTSVMQKFKNRAVVGKYKYGTDLDRTDLSLLDWIQHAQEELMDATLYLEKLKQLEENRLHSSSSENNAYLYIMIYVLSVVCLGLWLDISSVLYA